MRPALKNIRQIVLASMCLLVITRCGWINPMDTKLPPDAKQALVNASEVTAYSLEPDHAIKGKHALHGYTVLGSVALSGQEASDVKQQYIDALQEYQDERRQGHGSAMACTFQPHHALRITTEDHHIYDYVVCFNCGLITVYKDDAEYWNGQVRGTAVKLNEVLEAHHIAVAKTN